jgi:hypothetical protein
MALARYHVKIRKARTTVSIPTVLEELLALKLGSEPQTQEAHAAVRLWLQEEIDRDPGAIPKRGASQRLTQQISLEIAAPHLIKKRDAWNEERFG